MAGYSKTPLAKKLGIKENFKVRLIYPPSNFLDELAPLPKNLKFLSANTELANYIHLFAKDLSTFESHIFQLENEIERNGMIWISWYKKASKIPTDLTEYIVRGPALTTSLVDVKKCAVDEQWSGLKLVIRKELR